VEGSEEIGQIVCFLKSLASDEVWCCVDTFSVDHSRFFVHKASRFQVGHIIPIKETPCTRVFVPVQQILKEKKLI